MYKRDQRARFIFQDTNTKLILSWSKWKCQWYGDLYNIFQPKKTKITSNLVSITIHINLRQDYILTKQVYDIFVAPHTTTINNERILHLCHVVNDAASSRRPGENGT
jgi:hypothetical protein